MSNFLAMLRQNQQQVAPSLLPDLGGIAQGLMSGYDQGQQDRRQRALDARQAAADAQAAEDRKLKLAEAERKRVADERKAQVDKLTTLEKFAGRAALTGQGDTAANLYNQGRDLRQGLYGFAGPEIVGSQNPNLYDVETRQPMRTYGPQSMQTILGLTGTEQPKPIMVPGGTTALDALTHQPLYTAPKVFANGRYGNSVAFGDQQGGPVAAPGLPAASVVPPAPVASRGGGGGRSSGGGSRGGGSRGGSSKAPTTKRMADGKDYAWNGTAWLPVPGIGAAPGKGGGQGKKGWVDEQLLNYPSDEHDRIRPALARKWDKDHAPAPQAPKPAAPPAPKQEPKQKPQNTGFLRKLNAKLDKYPG